jgi:tetratricopeptide (TPR) repeat protein
MVPTLPSTMDMRGPTFLSGKVVVDDGTPLTDSAIIQSVCKGRVHNEGYTDSKGSFSIDLTDTNKQVIGSAQESDSGLPDPNKRTPAGPQKRDMRDCDLQAVLPGFTSQSIVLATKVTEFGNADVGVIVLHRMQQVEGFTISATSAMAPGKAKKEYQKGLEQMKKGKWEAAQAAFSKAVEVYPKYAVAWVELGRAQLKLNATEEAKSSFQKAMTADTRFLTPYEELAQLALKEKNWRDLADTTEQMVKLNGLSFPQFWYYNALANYFLRSLDQAEKSALQGMTVDVQHRIPKLEYLLANILIEKHDYVRAAEHLRNYIRLTPNADNIETAQKQVADLERVSAGGSAQPK